jgi:biotin operon repressor
MEVVQKTFAGALLDLYTQVAALSETIKRHGNFDPLAPVFPLSALARAVLEYLAQRQPFGGSPLDIARALNAPRTDVAAVLQALKQLGITYSPMRGSYHLGPPLSEAELRARLGLRRHAVVDTPPDTESDAEAPREAP